jgi:calcineurin-like phosphoesterase family protein
MNFKDLGLKNGQTLFATADLHLGEPRMGIMQRPFADAIANYTAMKDNNNLYVKSNDLVIWVGDAISNQAADKEYWLKRISQFNGRKWLIRGNHDEQFSNSDLEPYFERIINHGDGIEIDLTAQDIVSPESVAWVQKPLPKDMQTMHLFFTHYPTQSRADRFNIVGHIHAAWKYQKNMLNVGVDVNHFYPFHAHEFAFYLTAITSFYDKDVSGVKCRTSRRHRLWAWSVYCKDNYESSVCCWRCVVFFRRRKRVYILSGDTNKRNAKKGRENGTGVVAGFWWLVISKYNTTKLASIGREFCIVSTYQCLLSNV